MLKYLKLYSYHAIMGYGVLSLFIYGEVSNNENISNVAVFWFWFISVLGFFTVADVVKKELMKKIREGEVFLPIPVFTTWSVLMVGTCVYFGYFFLATVASVSSMVHISAKIEINKELERETKDV